MSKITPDKLEELLDTFNGDTAKIEEAFNSPNDLEDTPFMRLAKRNDVKPKEFEVFYGKFLKAFEGDHKKFISVITKECYCEEVPLSHMVRQISPEFFEKLLNAFDGDFKSVQEAFAKKADFVLGESVFHQLMRQNNSNAMFQKTVEVFGTRPGFKKIFKMKDKNNKTPLHNFMRSINPDSFDLLVKIYEDKKELRKALGTEDADGKTPLHILESNKAYGREISEKISEVLGADPETLISQLATEDTAEKNQDLANYLDLELTRCYTDRNRTNSYTSTVIHKYKNNKQRLIDAMCTKPQHNDQIPLSRMMEHAKPGIFRTLLYDLFDGDTVKIRKAFSIQRKGMLSGDTPLIQIKERRSTEEREQFYEILLDAFKDDHEGLISLITQKCYQGETVLHLMMTPFLCVLCERYSNEVFEKLLGVFDGDSSKMKEAFSVQDDSGNTPLHRLFWQNKGPNTKFQKMVEVFNADVCFKDLLTVKDKNGITPLHYLMERTNPSSLDSLAKIYENDLEGLKNALSTKDNCGRTPLMYLVAEGERKVEDREKNYEKLFEIFKDDHEGLTSLITQKDHFNIDDSWYERNEITRAVHETYVKLTNMEAKYEHLGKTPLHYMIDQISVQFFEKLLGIFDEDFNKMKEAFSVQDNSECTPFHRVMYTEKDNKFLDEDSEKHLKDPNKMFQKMIEVFGANPGFKEMLTMKDNGNYGCTPLHSLMGCIDPDSFEMLLKIYEDDSEGLKNALNINTKEGFGINRFEHVSKFNVLEALKYNERHGKEIRKRLNKILNAA